MVKSHRVRRYVDKLPPQARSYWKRDAPGSGSDPFCYITDPIIRGLCIAEFDPNVSATPSYN
jgi:hypothetical protein